MRHAATTWPLKRCASNTTRSACQARRRNSGSTGNNHTGVTGCAGRWLYGRGCECLSGTRVVEFYSTPFVFITDTFTGKVLCFFQLGSGHLFRSKISQLPTLLIPIRGSNISPHMGIDTVPYDTPSLSVHHTQIELGIGIPPVRQQVCTTSPQSYRPVENLVLCGTSNSDRTGPRKTQSQRFALSHSQSWHPKINSR